MRLLRAGAVLALLGACGVPVQSEPTVVPGASLPREAQDRPPQVPEPKRQAVEVYFVQSNRLTALPRQVAEVTLQLTLRQLFLGPDDQEAQSGIRTAIAPAAALRAVTTINGVAAIDVDRPFLDVTGEEQILAIAQTVFTATAIEGVDAVQLLVEGELVEIPLGDGTLTARPVTRADYPELAAPIS